MRLKKNIVSSALVIQCLFMEDKINYQQYLFKELENVAKLPQKPKLLLHACCGPCFTIPHKELKDYFDITIIYNNSNIYPEDEYIRRKEELKRFIKEVGDDIKVIELPYDNDLYNIELEPYADDYEGHIRCQICFRKRLSEGYQYAVDHGFDYFGTVMSISRYKNSQVLNQIGLDLEKLHPSVKWLAADFKKNDGYNQSKQIVKEHNMYFQHYCGCKYSYQKMLEKEEMRK